MIDDRTATRLFATGSLQYRTDIACDTSEGGYLPLKGENRERWEQLCKQAADEQDPEKLMELVDEINRRLDEKEQRLRQQKIDTKEAGS